MERIVAVTRLDTVLFIKSIGVFEAKHLPQLYQAASKSEKCGCKGTKFL
jgi:hypothetical protein